MKKTVIGVGLAFLLCLLFVSCTSTEYHHEMLPGFYVSFTDLSPSQYDFIGNVTGSASFVLYEYEDENYKYKGELDIYGMNSDIEFDSYLSDALDHAIYEMTEKAKLLNANMLILPSYSVESHDETVSSSSEDVLSEDGGGSGEDKTQTVVTVTVSAVAVKLLDRNGNSLEVF